VIFLIRHAHSDYSADEMRPLSASGWEAAERVADALERRPIARIVSSPYTRALQTVEPLARRLGIEVECDPELRERRLTDRSKADFPDDLAATWKDFDLAYPGGETSHAAQLRVSRAIRKIAEANAGPGEAGLHARDVAIASHGNAIALFLHTLDATVDFDFWRRMSVPDVYAIDTRGSWPWRFSRIWQPG
jgi:2,3-bisphosphoglycerate-dependent phosphoglycerate mutase